MSSDLASIHIESGVNDQGEGFCHIFAHATDRTILVGQLELGTVRELALNFLAVAEAAEQDAAVLRAIRKLELPDDLAGHIIVELRNSRKDEE